MKTQSKIVQILAFFAIISLAQISLAAQSCLLSEVLLQKSGDVVASYIQKNSSGEAIGKGTLKFTPKNKKKYKTHRIDTNFGCQGFGALKLKDDGSLKKLTFSCGGSNYRASDNECDCGTPDTITCQQKWSSDHGDYSVQMVFE